MKYKSMVFVFVILLLLVPLLGQPQEYFFDNCLYFNGSTYVQLSDESSFDLITNMTVEAWIYVSNWNRDWQAIVTKGDDAWRLQRDDNTCNIVFDAGGQQVVTQGVNFVGMQWVHIAATKAGGTLKIYINGILNNTQTGASNNSNQSDPVMLGNNSDHTDREFYGMMDEVRIWNYARSAQQIKSNRFNHISHDTGGLVAYYKLDSSSGTTVTDSAGGHNGTVHDYSGMYWVGSDVARKIFGQDKSYQFDGDDDLSFAPLWNSSPTQLTAELWFKPDQLQAGDRTVLYHGDNGEFEIKINDDDIIGGAKLSDGSWRNYSYSGIMPNQWYHAALVINTMGTSGLYINGSLVGSDNLSSGLSLHDPGSSNLAAIGSRYGTSQPFMGSVDEVRIWGYARSSQQVWDNRHSVVDPEETGLIAYYQFNETTYPYRSEIVYNMANTDDTGTVQCAITSPQTRVIASWPIGENYYGGIISQDTIWPSANLKIWGDITINSGVKLTLNQGTTLSFLNHYGILANGSLQALGAPGDSIVFTVIDSTGFHQSIGDDISPTGSWNGIVIKTSAGSDSTIIDYCILQYAKAGERYLADAIEQYQGSAIFVNGTSRYRISNSDISHNIAADRGGAVVLYNSPAGLIRDCQISYNYVLNTETSDDHSSGGGIYIYQSSSTVQNSIIAHNEATNLGGAVLVVGNLDYSAKLIANTISGNTAGEKGGAICLNVIGNSTVLKRNLIQYNNAHTGAGIALNNYSFHQFPTIHSNIIANNHAVYGGALSVNAVLTPSFRNNTIVGNEAEIAGGGLYFSGGSSTYSYNTIIWGNTSPEGAQVYLSDAGCNPFFRYCNIQGGLDGFEGPGSGVNYDSSRYLSCIDIDPEFVDIPGQPYAVHEASPCINRGMQDSAEDDYDYMGNPRVYQTGISTNSQVDAIMNCVDIGAYENQTDSGVMPYDYDLYTVIFNHNLTIPHGITLTIMGQSAVFAPNKGISVYGSMLTNPEYPPQAPYNLFLLSAQNEALGWNGLAFLGSPGAADSSYIENTKIMYGKTTGDQYNDGGGVYVNGYDKLVMSNSRILNCEAERGGALAVVDANPRFYSCLLSQNNALDQGGAVYLDDSSAYLIHNTIIDNSSVTGAGAILAESSSSAKLVGSIVWDNGTDPILGATNMQYCNVEGAVTGTNFNQDPQLSNSPNVRYMISSSSPCLNRGIIDTSNYPNFPQTDIHGNPRVYNHENPLYDRLDTGAYEYPGYMNISSFEASDGSNDYPGYVHLEWSFSSIYQPFTGFRIYRDDVLLETILSRELVYNDLNAIPGMRHMYSIEAFCGEESSPILQDIGFIKPNGIITGTVKTPNDNPVSGVLVSINPSLGYCLELSEDSFFIIQDPGVDFDDNFTLETWIKTNSTGCPILIKTDTLLVEMLSLSIDDNGYLVYTDGSNTISQEDHTIGVSDNNWHHVAFSYHSSSETACLYLDGVCVADSSVVLHDNTFGTTALLYDITGCYTGYVDDLRLWNIARSPEDILKSMNVIIPIHAQGLAGYWPMNEGMGDEAFDATDTANHAVLIGPLWSEEEPGIALGGVTDDWGEYLIGQIPYGHYTTFTVTPSKQGHFFQPQQRLITLSESSISANNVDFTDNSMIPISGRVMYVNTLVPVRNANILLNGASTIPPTLTDEEGYYVLDVEHGSDCVISASFNNQYFDRSWDLGNVVFPQSNKNFYNTTLVNFHLEVLGGDDRYPIGAFNVTARSTDDLYLKEISATELVWDIGMVIIPNLPPLDYNISVTPNPDAYPGDPFSLGDNQQFLSNNTLNLNLSNTPVFSDTSFVVSDSLSFIWYNPLEIEVDWPDDYELKYFADDAQHEFGFYLVEQNEWITVGIRAFEDYSFGIFENRRTYVTNCDININDEIGPVGLTETEFGGNAYYNYSFAPYLPNLSEGTDRPYQNMLDITVFDPVGQRYATNTDWALTLGARPTETTFSTVSPEIPFLILHDPPGDKSYASFNQSSSHSTGFQVSVEKTDNHNQFSCIQLGLDIVWEVGLLFSSQTEINITNDMNFGMSSSTSQNSDIAQVYTFTTTEEYVTSDDNSLIGRESDLYVGGAMNLLWGVTRVLDYDEETQAAEITNDIMVTPDGFATTYIYTESQIMLTVIPNALAIGDTASAEMWQSFVDMNSVNIDNAVENENHPANVSFNAGAGYMYEETTTNESSFNYTTETVVSNEFGGEIGATVNGLGYTGGFSFSTQYTWGSVSTVENETQTSISYVLADDDETSNLNYLSDYFTVDIKKDPVYGTPVFATLGGASSNRWEQNTQPRDGVSFSANTYTASGLEEDDQAVFILYLGNTSQTMEDRRYYLTLHHESNPGGATILINGLPLVERMPFDIPPGEQVQAVMTVFKGPYEYLYDDITLEFYAEGDRGNEGPDGHYFYLYKSFDVFWETPYSLVNIAYPHDDWIVNKADNDSLWVKINNYDVSKEGFQDIILQYKRPYNPDWITCTTIPLSELEGTTYKLIPWDLSNLSDGPFEIRAGTRHANHDDYYCDPIRGFVDRSSPEVVGLAKPSDGIYGYGDEISVSFSEFLDPNSPLAPGDVCLEIVRTSTMIDTEISRFENTIYLMPNIANYWIENEILKARVSGVRDLYGNSLEQDVEWEFFVNANPIGWESTKIEHIKALGETATITTQLVNNGGQWSTYSIDGLPQWLMVDVPNGSLLPLDYQTLNFTISNQLGYGVFRDTVYADVPSLGREPLILEISVLANPPLWATAQLDAFDHSMTITGEIYMENSISSDTNDIIGAFVQEDGSYVCRGVAPVTSVPYLDDTWQFFLTVHSDLEDGEELSFRVWDSSACKEHFGIQEQFVFSSGMVHGTPLEPITIHVNPELYSSTDCRSGWNWLSINLDNTASMDLNYILACLSPSENDLIKNQSSYAQFVPTLGWVGDLETISTTESFKLKLANPAEFEFNGLLQNPDSTTITYDTGWNWIGYLPHISLSVNQALSNLDNASTGDLLKNQTGYSQYIEGFGWFGSMLFMDPGKGFMLKTAGSGSFNYPDYVIPREDPVDSYQESLKYLRQITGWEVNPLDYEFSSCITSIVLDNQSPINDPNLLLGAFYGDECRGIASPVWVVDRWVFFLTQYSNTLNQVLSYKVYLADTDEIYEAEELLPFINNQILGHPLEPYQFHIAGATLVAPSNLELISDGSMLSLSWNNCVGATSYKVYASDSPDGNYTDISSQGVFNRMEEPSMNYISKSNSSQFTSNQAQTRERITWVCEQPQYLRRFFRVTAIKEPARN